MTAANFTSLVETTCIDVLSKVQEVLIKEHSVRSRIRSKITRSGGMISRMILSLTEPTQHWRQGEIAQSYILEEVNFWGGKKIVTIMVSWNEFPHSTEKALVIIEVEEAFKEVVNRIIVSNLDRLETLGTVMRDG